jgi:hypothetical protein
MERFNKFHSYLQQYLPNFKIKYKDESALMKILGYVLFFNKSFMTSFTTTLGQTVYFPSRTKVEKNEVQYMSTLAHEYVHARDANAITSVLFGFLYLIPITLAPLMLIFLFVHWALALALVLLCLAPLPAYFRKRYELRGYTMSLFMRNEIMKENGIGEDQRHVALEDAAEIHNEQFTGANYYFMWPFGVKDELLKKVDKVISGTILRDDPTFIECQDAFIESKK